MQVLYNGIWGKDSDFYSEFYAPGRQSSYRCRRVPGYNHNLYKIYTHNQIFLYLSSCVETYHYQY